MTAPVGEVATAYTVRQLAELHRAAQEKLGLSTGLVAFQAFSEVNVMSPTTGAAWFARIVAMTRAMRGLSRTLSARYYNLARAIETGYTYPDIDGAHDTEPIPASRLYEEMGEVLNEIINLTDPPVDPGFSGNEGEPLEGDRLDELDELVEEIFKDILPDEDSEDWTRTIEVENWDWPEDEDEDEWVEELEEYAAQLAAELSEVAGAEMENGTDREEIAKAISDATGKQADKLAGFADSGVMNEGRALEVSSRERDDRVVAYVRITGENPCGFCAMLASRGAVYKSKRRAVRRSSDGKKYHENCHCREYAVYRTNPYLSSRDVWYIAQWRSVIRNQYSGADALNAFRRLLYAANKGNKIPAQDDWTSRPVNK